MRNATSAAGTDDFHEDDGVVEGSKVDENENEMMGTSKRARTESSSHL